MHSLAANTSSLPYITKAFAFSLAAPVPSLCKLPLQVVCPALGSLLLRSDASLAIRLQTWHGGKTITDVSLYQACPRHATAESKGKYKVRHSGTPAALKGQ